jgi:hypothetical protein
MAKSKPIQAKEPIMKTQSFNRRQLVSKFAPAAFLLALAAPVMAQGGYRGNGPGPGTTVTAQPITAEEAKWLTWMREEEKLARDVYQQLFEKWNLSIFRNIAASEERHYSSVGTLLSRCGVPDPAQNNPAGVYSDSRLTALYNELMAKGTRSQNDALEVGVLIEKADIADLEAALQATTRLDIKRVYTNLLNGSFNHLEAFETTMEILGALVPAN